MDHRLFRQYDEVRLWETNMVIAFTYERALRCARGIEQGDYFTFKQLRSQYGVVGLEDLQRFLGESNEYSLKKI